MRRLLGVTTAFAFALAGCYDFEADRGSCRTTGRCGNADGGATGGGGVQTGGGGGQTGGGGVQTGGGGGLTGGGGGQTGGGGGQTGGGGGQTGGGGGLTGGGGGLTGGGGGLTGGGGGQTGGGGGQTGGGGGQTGGGGGQTGGGGGALTCPTCTPLLPHCNTTTGLCVECIANSNCSSSAKPLCNLSQNRCVQCVLPSDCSPVASGTSACIANACVISCIPGAFRCGAGCCLSALAISAGHRHTCQVTSAYGVKCWGLNTSGQIGDGTMGLDRLRPVDVRGLTAQIASISLGDLHTCALTASGGVQCWGENVDGRLGDGTSGNDRLTPVNVLGLTTGVSAISLGAEHACALSVDGGVKCWGNNGDGQLGDGTNVFRTTPVDVVGLMPGVTAISSGWNHTCALRGARIFCWGLNDQGQIGDGTRGTGRFTPTQVVSLFGEAVGVSLGGHHSCALMDLNDVKCWGSNSHGQIGHGTNADTSTPVLVTSLSSSVVSVSAGGTHTCAVDIDRGVKCWGFNNAGQVGDGTLGVNHLTPVSVVGLTAPIVAIDTGGWHTCALTGDGGVKCWGAGDNGQIGDGMSAHVRLTPVNVAP